MTTPQEGLQRLRDGNRRFVAGVRSLESFMSQARREDLVGGQQPFAVILGCSDSRVPVEMVFDQGLGDLFVIRVAGNIVAPTQVGSVEFAAEQFGTRLVVVLGHTCCGAVGATVDQLTQGAEVPSRNLSSIVDRIRPAVEGLVADATHRDREALTLAATLANVQASVRALSHGSPIVERLIHSGRLLVVGAKYSVETGAVEFLEDAAEST